MAEYSPLVPMGGGQSYQAQAAMQQQMQQMMQMQQAAAAMTLFGSAALGPPSNCADVPLYSVFQWLDMEGGWYAGRGCVKKNSQRVAFPPQVIPRKTYRNVERFDASTLQLIGLVSEAEFYATMDAITAFLRRFTVRKLAGRSTADNTEISAQVSMWVRRLPLLLELPAVALTLYGVLSWGSDAGSGLGAVMWAGLGLMLLAAVLW
jgi:hypothetical protein